MSSAQAGGTTFKVAHRGPGGQVAAAGTVAIGADHRISIVAAEPRFADLLDLAVETLNESDSFLVRAAPPPNAEPMTLHKRIVARTDADAGDAVIDLLRRNYGFELTPTD